MPSCGLAQGYDIPDITLMPAEIDHKVPHWAEEGIIGKCTKIVSGLYDGNTRKLCYQVIENEIAYTVRCHEHNGIEHPNCFQRV